MALETYYRKRSRKFLHPNNEMEYLKKQEQNKKNNNNSSSMDTAASDDPFLAKHNVPAPVDHEASDINIEVGSIYEIAHIQLPPRTPVHLRSIRVAMVSEKTEINVAVRYPSMKSLETYFSNSVKEMYPALDEKFVMGTSLASKVLLRQVPSKEFAEKKHLRGFWLINTSSFDDQDAIVKKGCCLSELTCNGMIRWGARRTVKFLGRHCENIDNDNDTNTKSSSSFVKGDHEVAKVEEVEEENEDEEMEEDGDDDGVKEEEVVEEEEEENEDDEEEDNGDEDGEMEDIHEVRENLKRKEYNFRDSVRKAKKVKREKQKGKQKKIPKKQNNCRQLMVLKSPKDRWSAERYKSAEKNLLEVMKAKGAVANKPILRPDLRAEARKKIGDTGLLDHLLKHVAGKLAPGGNERFRRRHNAEGQMEYWLESADLVNIRKEAGVTDPYWIPPPGWELGDSPTQDPICAKELKLLKQEILKVKRDVTEMASKKQMELQEEVRKLRREIKDLASKKKKEENQATVASSNHCKISEEMNELASSLVSGKLDLTKTPDSLEMCKEQLNVISDFVKEMQEKIGKVTSKVEETSKSNTALMVATEPYAEKEKKQSEEVKQNRKEAHQVVVIRQEGSENAAADDDQHKKQTTTVAKTTAKKAEKAAATAAEGKAAKIERLKSGFRICKPQGTFLWPNMVRNNNNNGGNILSPQVLVQVEDLFVVPTPPSVSSSTASAPPMLPYHHPPSHHHHPASPVKPLAERRGLTVTVSTVSDGLRYEDRDQKYTTTTTSNKNTTTMINLNDAPFSDAFCANPSSSRKTATTTTVIPHGSRMDEVAVSDSTGCSSAPSMSTQTGNWLALATPNSTSDESTHM